MSKMCISEYRSLVLLIEICISIIVHEIRCIKKSLWPIKIKDSMIYIGVIPLLLFILNAFLRVGNPKTF